MEKEDIKSVMVEGDQHYTYKIGQKLYLGVKIGMATIKRTLVSHDKNKQVQTEVFYVIDPVEEGVK